MEKIRRCIGLPYCGNKNTIAKGLIDAIQKQEPKKKNFYDLFGGGGSLSFEALYRGYNVYYNEINKSIYELQKLLIKNGKSLRMSKYGILPEQWYEFVSKEEFDKLKNDESDLAYNGFINVVYTFGNKLNSSYLYAKAKQDRKYGYHKKVMQSGKNWVRDRVEILNKIDEEDIRAEHLARISTLERYRSLIKYKNRILEISNKSYEDVELGKPEESIIICDIPYKGATRDIYGEKKTFNRSEFIEWCKKKAEEGYTIYVCEFDFEIGKEVYRKERFEHLTQKNNDAQNREEVLYMINKDTI